MVHNESHCGPIKDIRPRTKPHYYHSGNVSWNPTSGSELISANKQRKDEGTRENEISDGMGMIVLHSISVER